MKDIGTQKRDEFFVKRFNELYRERWKDQGKTQQDFADAIRAQFPNPDKCPCTFQYVSDWLRGKKYPEIYLPQIAKVLGVNEEEFTPRNREERYEFDPEYIEKVLSDKDEYRKKIKLNKAFVCYLRSRPAFSKSFPLYSPLCHKVKFMPDETEDRYVRMGFAGASQVEKEKPLYMVERDGKKIVLNNADLEFLKEVQNKVDEYVEFLFTRRAREMIEEEKTASSLCVRKIGENEIAHCHVPLEKLMEIDRFMKYVVKKTEE